MTVMPGTCSFIQHALWHVLNLQSGWVEWSGHPDIFAAIREARETLVRDTRALIQAVGTGMTKAAVEHIPAMQACSACQCSIPYECIKSAHRPVVVDQIK